MRARSFTALLSILTAAFALTSGGCGGPEYAGVELSRYVSDEYLDGVAASLERAGGNGPELVDAITRAPESDREALAFLVANLPSVDLATVTADFLLETVGLSREARERFPWGSTVPHDIYLQYVLPPRVSQEPLESWRGYLLEELTPRLAGLSSMEEAALEVNRWCGEHVGFRTTQRRDQGVFETLASGYGRCEEMMIVHIAACRSVSIPAREAWTPYWTTCDNNHAWTELWVDGEWHYTGACEPRDALDDAWFSERVAGAALVLSSVYGTATAGEELYRTEERSSLINSISHYAAPGTLSVVVTGRDAPAADTRVTVSVWNFGALRAIARMDTDASGRASLSLGEGEYFVCSGSPESYDWSFTEVRSGEHADLELVLDDAPPFDGEFRLMYQKGD
ncbi:MAG: transglutaminase-like domain-containing protein [Candidatus Eisenbacteria bacterium]|nr:transglutaminase-like domain-containing protein [Candidatus Eisenbacteria bacterium]